MSTLRNLSATSLSEQAYEAVRAAITKGDIKPGQRITERGLASLLGVSPTPVREALQRLIHDGQVERTGPRTLQVATLDDATLAEIDEIEVGLQVITARFAARKATDAHIRAMRTELDDADRAVALIRAAVDDGRDPSTQDVSRAYAAVRRFHDLVDAAADNPLLVKLTCNARAFSPEQRRSAAERGAVLEGTAQRYGDHRALLDALADHDEERAGTIADRHAREAHRDIRRVL